MSPPWTLNEGLRRRRPRRKLWANLEVIESGYSTLFAKQPVLNPSAGSTPATSAMAQSNFFKQLKRKVVNNLILVTKEQVIPAIINRLNRKPVKPEPIKVDIQVISSEPNK